MTQFKDKTWTQRFQSMGAEAETQFENYCHTKQIGFHRFGLNRPEFNVAKLPKMLAYTPDYMCEQQLVEVQGVGADQKIKVKHDKLEAMMFWDCVHPTSMWVWNRTLKAYTVLSVGWFTWTAADGQDMFDGTKPYSWWTIPEVKWCPADWLDDGIPQ